MMGSSRSQLSLDVLRGTFLPYSGELLGLRLGCAFGGRGAFGVSREDSHDVLQRLTYLSSKPVGLCVTAGVFGGHVEVDHILTHNDV